MHDTKLNTLSLNTLSLGSAVGGKLPYDLNDTARVHSESEYE